MSKLVLRFLPFIILIGLVLFPWGWLGQEWPPAGAVIDFLFANAKEHAVGHATIFFLFGTALLLTFHFFQRHIWLFFGVMLAGAVGQELFQAIYKQYIDWFDTPRDIVTDFVGVIAALLAVMAFLYFRKKRVRESI
jgi:hypothetical protein